MNAIDVAVRMWELRPDLGRLLDRYVSIDSPWALETSELLELVRAAFDVPEFSDPSGHVAGLTDGEVLNLFTRFGRHCGNCRINLRPDLV